MSVSIYQPSEAVRTLTSKVQKDYAIGYNILTTPYREFNDRTLLATIDDNNKKFNSYTEPKSDDPTEQWKWNGVRPITRNKVISIAAHILAVLLYPNFFAQNDKDEYDKKAAEIMRDLMKWNVDNSDYDMTMMRGVMTALTSPLVFFNVEFIEAMQTIRQELENGKIGKKEALDKTLSGIQTSVFGADEILIANAYEPISQKQRCLIKRKMIEYDEAESLVGQHENWNYVRPGIKTVFNETNQTFYDKADEDLATLCEYAVYYNRREDTEILFINGIYFGNSNVENNPIKHRGLDNEPKYPFVDMGYELISANFAYKKSAVDKMSNDQDLIDQMWRMTMDGTFLSIIQPLALIGGTGRERIKTDIMIPGASAQFPQGFDVKPLGNLNNLSAGWRAIQEIENSIDESSQSPRQAGQEEKGQQTAYEVARLEQNARIQLGLFGKMIAKAVMQIGDLYADLIVHNQTVGEVEELLGGDTKLKFRTFLLPEEMVEGKKVAKKIRFSESLIGTEMTEKMQKEKEYKLLEEEGGIDGDMRIYEVNPDLFSKLKFKAVISADSLIPKNEQFEKALKLEGYDRMIANPLLDQQAITKDFLLGVYAQGNEDKYILKREDLQNQVLNKRGKSPATPLVNQMTKNSALAGILPE